ncbi:sn-glycerol-3-phosphate ABC transporter ATP-binding protein UgpC [Pseudoclavibacter sp. CFCC 13796]|uniref:ABC transporter ATP-binding protein n=1 Tax=unclassified Pseudoclavibacter TaxID=2615177 RepID=UPI001300DEA1|nr:MULTISPECIES: sn-glycerol-3-phosphate ABC transporter ATP-binding protein UgpC [unclassified Pseudoclavibacter]KAB1661122.1 sn-glycerol-3-phosphate ABC transporter ATP-binding protein UgpC [Pseudoclavibacter sp. CFCC 13796]MCD7101097.1 sn-glycerol-3-phosphate ABC transporter ATP-binding protein UgpC [Pseudoclavibacter sp. 13-3]
MATVTFTSTTRVYPGQDHPALNHLDLEIDDGEFLVLVGPSGCGKSTTLRMLAGLEEVSEGRILIDGKDITTLSPRDRDIAMVFQNYALYPHMTVAENMGFALKMAKVPKAERERRVREAARLLDLEPYLDRRPKALSGGQRQRVAMGRAVVREPKVFLMDEPLSNLDAKLRVQTRTQIAQLQRRLNVTTVYVTHDQTEALTMGDRIAVLKDGDLQQVGTPRELYETPANEFVAGFLGSPSMNLLEGVVDDSGVRLGTRHIDVPAEILIGAGPTVTFGVRPEDLYLSDRPGEGLKLKVDMVEELGADGYLFGHPTDQPKTTVVARVDGRDHPAPGDVVRVVPKPNRVHLFDRATGNRLYSTVTAPVRLPS